MKKKAAKKPLKKKKLVTGLAATQKKKALRIQHLGGLAISKNRAHMARIGRKGGLASRK